MPVSDPPLQIERALGRECYPARPVTHGECFPPFLNAVAPRKTPHYDSGFTEFPSCISPAGIAGSSACTSCHEVLDDAWRSQGEPTRVLKVFEIRGQQDSSDVSPTLSDALEAFTNAGTS